jgi:hypothetical protein
MYVVRCAWNYRCNCFYYIWYYIYYTYLWEASVPFCCWVGEALPYPFIVNNNKFVVRDIKRRRRGEWCNPLFKYRVLSALVGKWWPHQAKEPKKGLFLTWCVRLWVREIMGAWCDIIFDICEDINNTYLFEDEGDVGWAPTSHSIPFICVRKYVRVFWVVLWVDAPAER